MEEKPHILSFSIDDLKEKLLYICKKPFIVKQVLRWVFIHHLVDFTLMTNLSKEIRERLSDEFDCSLPSIIDVKKSNDKSKKLLLKLHDNNLIEMVFMPSSDKNSLCISSQVGCSRLCAFCATGKLGLKRNLKQEELLAQVLIAFSYFKDHKITNIVLMGMGEPLDNIDNVLSFLRVLQAEDGFRFSGRRTTLSTCGIVPRINDLSNSGIKLKLAVSLNSAIDEKRSKIMPVNNTYPLSELKSALLSFRKKTNFRITFEYVMIDDFNMGSEDIKALIKFCGDISCKLNLIKWNKVSKLSLKSPSDKKVEAFIEKLQKLPCAVTYRKSRGVDIAGACGQLATTM